MIVGLVFVVAAQNSFALHEGDRVVFYGDSITEQRLYTTYVEAYTATRFPTMDVRFYNAGWSGDSTWGGGGGAPDQRVARDVKPYRPTVVTIMLGMNDGGYVPYDARIFGIWQEWYGKLLGYLKSDVPDARITLIQTSPFDDFAHKPCAGYNDVLVRFGTEVKNRADRSRLGFADFNRPLADVLKRAAKDDPKNGEKIVPDRIHPAPAGHLVMAEALLRSWHAPSLVSSVVLDATSKRIDDTQRATVTDFDGLKWTQLDESLPFPLDTADATVSLVLRESDFVQALDRQLLTVRNLAKGSYRLSIDETNVGRFSSDQLSSGVNLAQLDTPMRKQAARVLDVATKRNDVAFLRWREIQIPFGDSPSGAKAVSALDDLLEDLRRQERNAAQPSSHRFALTRLPS